MNDIVRNKFRRLLAVAGSPEEAAELLYPTTPVGKDDQAWEKIVKEMDSGSIVTAKALFLTRCAESAQEALERKEKKP